MRELVVDGKTLSRDGAAYVIAEIGHNHQGELEKAKALVHSAKECGVDAVKFQKRDNRAPLHARVLRVAVRQREQLRRDVRRAPRGARAADERLVRAERATRGRRASRSSLRPSTSRAPTSSRSSTSTRSSSRPATCSTCRSFGYVAAFGKPIFLSTGGGTIEDIDRAVDAILPLNAQLCVLHCTASYPAEVEDLNLSVIATLRERYPDLVIGLSDHHNGIAMAPVAFMLGARVFEKHFTLNHAWKGTDHAYSLMPDGMRRFVRDLHRVPTALGDGVKRKLPSEERPLAEDGEEARRGARAPAGHVLAPGDLVAKSPADGGLPPYELDRLLGRTLLRPLALEQDVALEDVELAEASAAPPATRERPAVRPRRPRRGRHRRDGAARAVYAAASPSAGCGSRSSTSRCGDVPDGARAYEVDVTDRASIEAAIDEVEADWGVPHLLVNNAGLDSPPDAPAEEVGPFEEYPEASFDEVMDVNVKGTFLCCQVVGGAMARAGRGSIVNVSSVYGLLSPVQDLYAFRRERGETFVKPVAYSVSKSAILNLTRYLATYWAKEGVRVNTLTLAGVWNDQPAEFLEAYSARVSDGPDAGRAGGARRRRLPRLGRLVVRHRLEPRRRRRLVGVGEAA